MKKLFNRLSVTAFVLIIQLILTIFFLDLFVRHWQLLFLAAYVLSFITVLKIIKSDEAAVYQTSWITLVLLFPIGGIIIYALVKNPLQTKRIKEKLEREREKSSQLLAGYSVSKHRYGSRFDGIANYLTEYTGYASYKNTDVSYYSLGQYMFQDMTEDLKQAKKYIFLQYFIVGQGYMWRTLEKILVQKAQAGVEVRLIFDDLGSAELLTEQYKKKLESKGIKILIFSKIKPIFSTFENNRNHRKILVIDGKVAYSGGINLTDEYINFNNGNKIWKDTGVRLVGEAVLSFTLLSIEIWNAFCEKEEIISDYHFYRCNGCFDKLVQEGLVFPYGDSPLDSQRIGENVYIDILNKATDYVYIFTPFLILSEYMIAAMQMAKKRGVDVRLILPGIPDWKTKSSALVMDLNKSYYKYLQQVGIKVYEYPSAFVHAKVFVSDDEIATVGTINLDYRSLYLNFECGVLFYGGEIIQTVKQDWLDTMKKSREVTGDGLTPVKRWINTMLILFVELM